MIQNVFSHLIRDDGRWQIVRLRTFENRGEGFADAPGLAADDVGGFVQMAQRYGDQAAGVDDVIRRIQNAVIVQPLTVTGFGQLIVGGTSHDVAIEGWQCRVVENATQSARRQDMTLG